MFLKQFSRVISIIITASVHNHNTNTNVLSLLLLSISPIGCLFTVIVNPWNVLVSISFYNLVTISAVVVFFVYTFILKARTE